MTLAEGDSEVNEEQPIASGPDAIDISPDKDGGVLKEIIKQGIGNVCPAGGSMVSVHYVGRLTNGEKFDSSRDRDKPFKFNLGKRSVIKGWDIGVATMTKGEIAVFTIAAKYGYGSAGSPPKIPKDATLIFEIELIDWVGEDLSSKKDGGIIRYLLTAGEGYSTPNEGALIEAHIIGKHGSRVFEERDVSFALGEGSEHGICEGLEKALEQFKKGEKSRIVLKSKYAFNSEGKPEFEIPPDTDIEYEVELKNFEKAKESWMLGEDEKLDQANLLKEKGTKYFKDNKFELAIKMYKKAVQFIESDTGFGDKQEDRKVLLVAIHLNLAISYLKTSEEILARDECDSVLQIQPENVKGLFRRGQANLNLLDLEKAKSDFEAVLKIEPDNKAVQNNIIVCQNKLKEQTKKEKKIYANMFEKFAQRDREAEKNLINGWWENGKVIEETTPFVEIPKETKVLPKKLIKKEETDQNDEPVHAESPKDQNEII